MPNVSSRNDTADRPDFTVMPRKAREPNWQKSDAKKLLLQDLRSGEIPLDSENSRLPDYC
jgi:hypothetical protein